ncbi:MAG: hypothetical protein ABIQ95_04620 [Bdellovibrionia bacterium]
MAFYFLRRPKTSALFVLLLLALAIFGFSLNFGFVLDDESQVVNNLYIHSLSNIFGAFTGSTMESLGAKRMAGVYYKPLMTVSYILLWAISHEAWIFHAFQLILHVLNSFLVFLFFVNIGKFSKFSFNPLLGFFAAVGFLVHPVNVEAVVYIADLQDILYSFFGLLALNFVASYQGSRFKTALYLGILLECALLSKESGVLYLLITGCFCAYFDRRKLKLWAYAVLGAGALYMSLRLGLADLNHGGTSSQMLRADLIDRLISVPKIFFHYFVTFIFPKELALVQDWVVKDFSISDFWLPLCVVLILLAAGKSLLRKRRDPIIFFFLAWFILGMGAHSNLVPLDGTVADRWFYFPLVGLLGVMGFYFNEVIHTNGFPKNRKLGKLNNKYEKSRARNQGISILVASIILLVWSGRSFARTLDWKTALLLYQHDLKLLPDSFYLQNNVGVELFRIGDTTGALGYFQRSTELFPGWNVSWTNLGSAHEKLGNIEEAERCFKRSVDNGPSTLGYQNYASLLLKLDKKAELKTFMEEHALPNFPDNPIFKEFYGQSLH